MLRSRGRVRTLAASLTASSAVDQPEPLSQDILDYHHSPARHYIHDVLDERAGVSLREAIDEGRRRFEADLAGGEAWTVDVRGIDEPDPSQHNPVVYYMRLGDNVKIGTSRRIGRRVAQINPQGVLAVEWGSYEVELLRHRQFMDLHVHGEWFQLRDALVDHIVECRAAFEASTAMPVERWLAGASA